MQKPDMLKKLRHHWNVTSRREFFAQAGSGLAGIALASMLAEDGYAAGVDPLAPKTPHVTPRAKNIIWCFMEGGPSHIDLFDPKPELIRLQGQPLPPSYKRPVTAMGVAENALLPSRRTFKKHGESGLEISDWYPHIAECADELCVLRSCWADGLTHVNGVTQMNTGITLFGKIGRAHV